MQAWTTVEDTAREQGRDAAWGRLPILAWMAWLAWDYLDYHASTVLFGLTLGVHELGHLLTMPFGPWVCAPAGTAAQILAPLAAAYVLWRQGEAFGMAFCISWLGTTLNHASHYAGDARALAMPLLSPFGKEAYHDWNWMLDNLGMLEADHTIAWLFWVASLVAFWGALGWGTWMWWLMYQGVPQTVRSAPIRGQEAPTTRQPTADPPNQRRQNTSANDAQQFPRQIGAAPQGPGLPRRLPPIRQPARPQHIDQPHETREQHPSGEPTRRPRPEQQGPQSDK